MSLDDYAYRGPLAAESLVKAAQAGILRHPTVEHRACAPGRGSGLALVLVDVYGREHVYVTPQAHELLERIQRESGIAKKG